MTEVRVARMRTGWDVVIGALLVVLGLVILGDAAVATAVSVLFIGWLLIIAGVLGLVASLFRVGKDGFWSALLGGALLTVLGLAVLRNTQATAITLTLLAGTVFLVSGVFRLGAAAMEPEHRVTMAVAGVISTLLGLMVLFNLVTASYVLLGVLLGVQVLVDGLTMMVIGRLHVKTTPLDAHAVAH